MYAVMLTGNPLASTIEKKGEKKKKVLVPVQPIGIELGMGGKRVHTIND